MSIGTVNNKPLENQSTFFKLQRKMLLLIITFSWPNHCIILYAFEKQSHTPPSSILNIFMIMYYSAVVILSVNHITVSYCMLSTNGALYCCMFSMIEFASPSTLLLTFYTGGLFLISYFYWAIRTFTKRTFEGTFCVIFRT